MLKDVCTKDTFIVSTFSSDTLSQRVILYFKFLFWFLLLFSAFASADKNGEAFQPFFIEPQYTGVFIVRKKKSAGYEILGIEREREGDY